LLVADDEEIECCGITNVITECFPQITVTGSVHNGAELIRAAREQHPDIIIADINMPGINGLDAIEVLRQEKINSKVIINTAYSYFEYAKKAILLKAADYLLKPFDSAQINACLQKLGLLTEKQEHREERSENPFCAQFSVWLANHYMQDISLEEAAEAMGMSSFYFSRFFRTAYNRTFLEYLTSYRIERAEELLRQTDIPVREIAPRVGYTDANYFTKVFKRHCGCTPTDYRSRL
ncbi:MAG: helix-turn-helix domain-containing protein, partial [Agathobaculum sp.]|nr:helix-turn-helix domain-containing protein [Agathobaculum sp.]